MNCAYCLPPISYLLIPTIMNIDIDHIAALAKLTLTDEERVQFSAQLPRILEYVGKLNEVDTSGVDAKAYLTDAVNVFRPDVAVPVVGAAHDALLSAFPKRVGDSLQVPGVFE